MIVAAIVALVLLVGTSLAALLLLRHQVTDLATRTEPQLNDNRSVRVTMTEAQLTLSGYLRSGQTGFRTDYLAMLPELSAELAGLDTSAVGDPALADLVRDQRAKAALWRDDYAARIVAGQITAGDTAEMNLADRAFNDFVRANDAVVVNLHEHIDAGVRQSKITTVAALVAIVMIGVLGKVMVIWPGVHTLRYIGPPLESLHRVVRALRKGDLDARADSTRGATEIRSVARAVNALADSNQSQRAQLNQRLGLSEFVHRLALRMNAQLDLDAVIGNSVQPIAEQFGTTTAWIRAWEGTTELPGPGRRVQHPADRDLDSPTFLISCARHIAFLAWERQLCYILGRDSPRDDAFISADDHAAMLEFVGQVGVSSMIMVPVGDGADCFGYLALSRPEGAAGWGPMEQDALLQVGHDLGRSIRHARILRREQELVADLQALDVQKREFVATVSHELRTPLASIIGHLELVRGGDLGLVADDMAVSLSAISRNSVRLSRLIEDLLLLSRIEENSDPTSLTVLDLATLVGEVMELHAESAQLKSIDVVVEELHAFPVLGDADEIDRVISNLLGNAIKFSPDGGSITITITGVDDHAVISIADRGLGISAADQDHLFTRFFRSTNPAALLVPGTGLGLAITALIVQQHRGQITVASTVGEGSTFTVAFPSVIEMQQQVERGRQSPEETSEQRPVLA